MFKIAKLEEIDNEKVDVNVFKYEKTTYKDGNKESTEIIRSLNFNISAGEYSFDFSLNCELEKLYEIKMNDTIDFKEYVLQGETSFYENKNGYSEPEINIKVTRYTENDFIFYIILYTENYEDDTLKIKGEMSLKLDDASFMITEVDDDSIYKYEISTK